VRRNTAGRAGEPGLRALQTLARRGLSAAGLREALRRAGLSPESIEAELEAAIRLGALDERRSAEARARALLLRGGWPREALGERLVREGYPAALAHDALDRAIAETGWEAATAARRALVPGEPAVRSARRLLARGFPPELVRTLVPGVEGMDEGG
jgi:SOS response regulatory protein OraA/RecX